MTGSEFLTINEVCMRYALSRSTFYRMLRDASCGLSRVVRRIPPRRGRVHVPVVEFEAWLDRKQEG